LPRLMEILWSLSSETDQRSSGLQNEKFHQSRTLLLIKSTVKCLWQNNTVHSSERGRSLGIKIFPVMRGHCYRTIPKLLYYRFTQWMDYWYTSQTLCNVLIKANTSILGTVIQKRRSRNSEGQERRGCG